MGPKPTAALRELCALNKDRQTFAKHRLATWAGREFSSWWSHQNKRPKNLEELDWRALRDGARLPCCRRLVKILNRKRELLTQGVEE
jgi:hypothetical protein